MLYKQYKEKYTRLKNKEDNKLVTLKRLIYKKCYNLNLLLLGKKGFNFYNIFTSKYKTYKC